MGSVGSGNNLVKQSEDWYYNKLTDAEKVAVAKAQYNTQQLNEYLSNRQSFSEERTAQLSQDAKELDSALSKFKLNAPIVTYRGVSLEEFTNTYMGFDETTQGVKSTSYDESRANAFAQNQGGYVIEYHIKPGHHGADVNGVPGANEREFLIRHNMKQTVIKKVNKNKIIVEVG